MALIYAQISVDMPMELLKKGVGWQDRAVYTEAALYCRDKLTDGIINRNLLGLWMPDLPAPQRVKRLNRLRDLGALVHHPEGWAIPAHVWAKWGRMRADVEVEREMASEAGVKGNHERWHVGPDGKPSPKCSLCRRDRIGGGDRGASRVRSPETETETETETEAKEDLSSSSVKLTVVRADPQTDDDQFRTAIDLVVAAKRIRYEPHDPGPWLARVIASTPSEHGATIRAGLAQGRSPLEVAGELVGGVYARQAARKLGVPIPDEEAVS